MAMEIFWGGAPPPLTQDAEGLEALRAYEKGRGGLGSDEDSEADGQNGDDSPAPEAAKRRVPGGMAATSKAIKVDYDSDDARIIELKQQAYSDDYVANKLKEEGRMRYVGKTVGSRWLRLRKVLEERDEERLDDEMSDWHVGEDAQLATIKGDVDKKFAVQFKRLHDKMWKEVAIFLADSMSKKKYTATACRERFEALKAGTALLPIELDDDQAGRRIKREERIARARAKRVSMHKAARDAEILNEAKRQARKEAKIEANLRNQERLDKKAEERKLRKAVKEQREKTRTDARHAQLIMLARMRLEREWQMTKLRTEKKIYKEKTGKNLNGKVLGYAAKRKYRDDNESGSDDDEDDEGNELESDDEEAQMTNEDSSTNEHNKKSPRARGPDNRPKLPLRQKKGTKKSHPQTQDPNPGVPAAPMVPAPVTKETLLNPRSIFTDSELRDVLRRRTLAPWQPGETHAAVVARIAAADESLNRTELDDLLGNMCESKVGNKARKIRRIQDHDASESFASKEMDLSSSDIHFMRIYKPYQQDEFRAFLDEAEAAYAAANR